MLQKSALAVACALALAMGQPLTSPKQGRAAFEKRCTGCHSLDNSKVGPPLRRVFSRRGAAESGFPYSDALKSARITWDAAGLDRWLLDPDAVVPGNDMSFRLENAEERAAIVSYLRELAGK